MKKYKFNIILLVVISFLVIFFSLKDNLNESLNHLANINVLWILVAIIFMGLNIMFQTLSQYRFLKEVDSNYKFSSCIKLMIMAMFFNGITPFSSGGQPFEVYLLKKEGIKVSDSANALLQNFITYQLSLIIIGTIALLLNKIFNIFSPNILLKSVVILGYTINVLVMSLIIFFSRAKKLNTSLFSKIFNFIFHFKFIKNKEQKKEKALKMLDDFYNSSSIMKNNLRNTLFSFLYNLLSLVCLYMIPLFVFFSLKEYVNINVLKSFVASAYTFLIGSFVPIPGGTGGLEYSFTKFFSSFINGSKLSVIMLVWRLITYYLGIFVGGITLITYRKKE